MKNERGSAIVLVLLLLGILGLLGAGLLVQTRYDIKLTRAQGSYDKMLNLADGSAKYSLFALRWLQPPAFTGQPVLATDTLQPNGLVDIQPRPSATYDSLTQLGYWQSRAWYAGLSTDPWDVPGYEIGNPTYHQDRWVANGSGSNGRITAMNMNQITITGQALDMSYNVNQANLFNSQTSGSNAAYYDTVNRQQVNAQSSALVSAVSNVRSE